MRKYFDNYVLINACMDIFYRFEIFCMVFVKKCYKVNQSLVLSFKFGLIERAIFFPNSKTKS